MRELLCRAARTAVLAVPVLGVFLSWSRYTAAMSPESGAATVGSAQMGYGAVLLGGVRQLLGIGRDERFGAIMQAMGQALFSRRVCLLGAPVMVLALVAGLSLLAVLVAPRGEARRRVVTAWLGGAFCFAALYLFHLILYYYNFSEEEGLALKDYERYLMPYLQGWVMAALCLLGQSAAAAPGPHPSPPAGNGRGGGGGAGAVRRVCLAGHPHRRVLDPGGQPVHRPAGCQTSGPRP